MYAARLGSSERIKHQQQAIVNVRCFPMKKFDELTEVEKQRLVNFYDYLVGLECAVVDKSGNHCLEFPTNEVIVDSVEVVLCDRCYQNYLSGAYSNALTTHQRRPVLSFVKSTSYKLSKYREGMSHCQLAKSHHTHVSCHTA